ncbi:helix-turn-helix domain-containing protein [Lactobacillus delbrueckii]|nr:helix-turn-helix transcriptional regulator [Lactobacillus delbrueckii]ASW10985.1 XRE family transcriptional regulator [Lactobacillus delbrueckii subsp. lactis DSM 20072]MCD5488242.1 helix-turn-helix domain-containing protein [Lactobacillus delbrueckii subsp. lactis]MCD5513755.1 helix-turn-helix domain-containing protein [Lactobacillus delbrueckii subsp. lactis]MCD5516027.1 helix-turn-helix domain-containing protein [Lactobacillus delbrueckii subsp. lactis]MCD5521727.1 helix-turn-helix domai
MKIGEALRKKRLELGLTQQEMCEGILSRPFYAKVESGKNRINAESLFKILFARQIDLVEFGKLVQGTYDSAENKAEKRYQSQMNVAVSTKDLKLMEKYCQDIIESSNDEILQLRALVALAYFKGELGGLSKEIRVKIKEKFDEGRNWTKRPELLGLLANTMLLWDQDDLNYWIGDLLKKAKKKAVSDLILERYLRLFENYLVICYERKADGKEYQKNRVDEVIKYIISVTAPFQLMIYRITALYLHALLTDQKGKAQKIKKDMEAYGYGNAIASWPE